MATYARLAIAAWRQEPCVRLLRFRGIDLTGVDLRMQVRIGPNVAGEPKISLTTVTSAGDEGLRLLAPPQLVDGVVTSEVQLNISKATMSSATMLPYGGDISDDTLFAYQLQIGGITRLAGDFVALATVMDTDSVPADEASSSSSFTRVAPFSAVTIDLKLLDTVEVTIAGIDDVAEIAGRAEAAAERAAAAIDNFGTALLPTEVINGHFDPALRKPSWAFGGIGAPAIVAADAAFVSLGIDRVARIAAGGAMYLEVEPQRLPRQGDYLAASYHVRVPDASRWPEIAGRLAIKLIHAGGGYAPGGYTDIVFDPATYNEIDATHREYHLLAKHGLSQDIVKITLTVNVDGLSFGVDVGAPAYASAIVRPAGVDWTRSDPFGVEAMKAEISVTAPSIYLAGDSLVDGAGASGPGATIAARIAYYLGGSHSALGVPGSFSGQIVDREVAVPLTLANNRLESGGTTVIEQFRGRPIIGVVGAPDTDSDYLPDWSNQPLTSPATGRAIERRFRVAGVPCVMRRTGTPAGDVATTSEAYVLTNGYLSTNVFVSPTHLVARAEAPDADFYGIWAGTNDRYLPDVVVANVLRWYEAHAGASAKRFVMTPLCQSTEPLGSTLGERTREIAARLGEACGIYAIDMLSELLANGLRSQGLAPATEDFESVAIGVIPARLRSDSLHLNDAGYDAAAQSVVCNFVAWGWIERAQLANVPPLLDML